MNKVILQLWEESNIDEGCLNDGCSLHIDINERNNYVANIYKSRTDEVPDKYDSIVGEYIEAFITDDLYNLVITDRTIKLPENSFQNLLKFNEIIINESKI